jgi:hypothetical protein
MTVKLEMDYNSERRAAQPSWELSPPRTRRESVAEVENMSVRELEHHISELHQSIAAMRESSSRTIPQFVLSPSSGDGANEDRRPPSRLTSTVGNRSVPARGTVEAAVQPSLSVGADRSLPVVTVDAPVINRRGTVDDLERRMPS